MSPVAHERRAAPKRARSRISRWFYGAGAALVISGSAWGVGLGKLDVRSALDEPFEGVIELLAVAAEDLETIKVSLGTRSDFKRAEIDRSNILDTFVFETEAVDNGESQITIRSTEVVSEPYVQFLISFEWAGGRIIREYTALLDPPEYAAVGEVVSVADTGAAETHQTISETSTPVLSLINSLGYAPGNEYGPIKRGETLADIAQQLDLPSDINVYQRMLGLLKQNPDAFIRENMNLVRQGASLTVPDVATFSSISPLVAIETYRRQVAEWEAYRTAATEQKGKTTSDQASANNTARDEPTKDRVWVRQVALPTPEGDSAPAGALVSETAADAESPSAAKVLSGDKSAQSDETPTDVMPTAGVEGDRYVLRIIQGKAERDEALASSSSGGVISTASAASSVVPEGTPGVAWEGVQDQLTLVEEALLSSQSQNQNLQDRMALLEQQISQTTQLLEQQLATTARLLALREAGLALAQQQAKARQEAAQDDKAASVAAAPTTTTPTTPTTTTPTTTTPTTTTPTTTNDASPVVVGADDSAQQTRVGAGDKTTTALTVSTAVAGAQEKIVTPEAPRGLLAQWADSAATIPLVGAALAGGLRGLGELGELGGLSDVEWGGNLNVAGVSVPVTWLLAITALLILLVLWRVRQRRAAEAYDDDEVFWADGVADADAQQAGGSDGEAEADVGVLSQDSIGSGFVAQTEAARGVSVTTDEVDPVAEADLYAAYGRVEQAIEVLRSAIRANPERIEFKVKLLEVLAQQGDAAAFEALAQEVSGLVETRSAEWTTISKFGRSLNPDNPLFGKVDSRTSDTALAPDEDGDVAAALPGLDLDAELDSMFKDASTAPSPAAGLEPPAAAMDAEQVSSTGDTTETPTAPVNLDASAVAAPAESALGASDAQVDRVGDVDDMGLDFDPAQAVIEVPEASEAPEPSAAEPSGDAEESVNTIEFTLEDPLSDDGGDALAESSDSTGADDRDIEGKLDLARAYVEIGDQTAAIELLDEIDQQGTSAHKEVADALRKELTG